MSVTEDIWRTPQEAVDHISGYGLDGNDLMPWGGEFHWPQDPESYPWHVRSAVEFLMGPDEWRFRRRLTMRCQVRHAAPIKIEIAFAREALDLLIRALIAANPELTHP